MTTPPSSGQTQHSRPSFLGTRRVSWRWSNSHHMTDLVFKSICWVCRGMHKTGLNPFFFFLLVGDWPKKTQKIVLFLCVCLCCVSASVPHFSSLCFHVCAARFFTVRRNRYTCVPAASHAVFCKASLCGCIVCRCYYSFTLLLFILTHIDRHTSLQRSRQWWE